MVDLREIDGHIEMYTAEGSLNIMLGFKFCMALQVQHMFYVTTLRSAYPLTMP